LVLASLERESLRPVAIFLALKTDPALILFGLQFDHAD
jgi:hypothetical protein